MLFDTGASHSFISRHYYMSIRIVIEEVHYFHSVGTPMG
ncbi:hypothetical protein, partial [Pseudomonas syringae]